MKYILLSEYAFNRFTEIGHWIVSAANDTVFCYQILLQHLLKST